MVDRADASAKAPYQIRIQGILDESWSDWFGDAEMAPEQAADGSAVTLLAGTWDHSALHGMLAKLRDLNLTLLSVTRVETDPGQRR